MDQFGEEMKICDGREMMKKCHGQRREKKKNE